MLEAQGSLYTELYFCTALRCCVAGQRTAARSKSTPVPCGSRTASGIGMRMRIVGFFSISQRGASQAARGLHAGQAPALCGPCGGTTRMKKLYRPACCELRAESQSGEKKKRNIREQGSSGAPGRACGASPGVSDQAVESGGAIFGSLASDRAVPAAVCAGVQEKSSCLVCAGVHIVGRVNCARAARTRQHAAAQDGGLLQVERPR